MTAPVTIAPGLTLQPIDQPLAEFLGPAIAGIDPWASDNYPAASMTAFLTYDDPALSRFAVMANDAPAGIIALRSPWLRGPYLQLLALLTPFQGKGIGGALLTWFETQAQPRDRWLWLCHSSVNTRAAAFYGRHGFENVAELTELLEDGANEVLMRKRIAPQD